MRQGPGTPSAGRMYGPYQLEGLLAGGGQALMYRARDTRIDRVVALELVGDPAEIQLERLLR